MLIKNFNELVNIIMFLSILNSAQVIDENQLINALSEIYYQPYPEFSKQALYFRFPDFDNFKKPTTTKIAIQIGHLINEEELPLELKKVSKVGAVISNIKEVDINKGVGYKIKEILERDNYNVEILTAIIPQNYYADVFISIHSNSAGEFTSGFMISTPFKDYSGLANKLKSILIKEYSKETGLNYINKTTTNMTHYYAFNWSKFKRTIHPKTPAIIIEMGNMRNKNDLNILLNSQDKIAQGIAKAIKIFLKETKK
ncbi:MAG: hypothetical protein KatS3mg095_0244 [Candidatus Parcubacteria bacterium]|nr:MAG: hypothetical protein KatS3mg095_0244 [Candidatus Parcubacteria bacterium]